MKNTKNIVHVTELPIRTSTTEDRKLLWTLAYNSRTNRTPQSNQQQIYKQVEMLTNNKGKTQIFLVKK